MINYPFFVLLCLSAISCGNPGAPAHGRIVFNDGVTFGSSVAYACWEGFKTSGLTTRHCTTNGTWTGQPPDCVGRTHLIESCFEMSKCLVFLDEQKQSNKMNVICQIILLYLNTVLSLVISCGDPGPVANGIYVGNDFTYNHTVVYHCNPGHLMEPAGQGTLRCTKEGAWNQTKPSCKGKSSQRPAGQIAPSFSLFMMEALVWSFIGTC